MNANDKIEENGAIQSSPETGGETGAEGEFLHRVREGVRRFILDKINVDEYKRTYRDKYSHPLTRSVLLSIIDAASGTGSRSTPDEGANEEEKSTGKLDDTEL